MNLIFEFTKFFILSMGIVLIAKYLLVPILRKISKLLGLGAKATGNISGIATSVPEFLTVTSSSLAGFIGTSIYNIISSNTINFLQYIFAIYLNKNQKFLSNKGIKINLILTSITILIPIFLVMFNIKLNMVLVAVFMIFLILFYYINYNVHKLYLEKEDKEILEEITNKQNISNYKNKKNVIFYFLLLIAIAVLLFFVGELLTKSLEKLNYIFNLPEYVLGICLGLITSVPELITFNESQKKYKIDDKHKKMGVVEATNNLLTSNILNLFVIESIGIILYKISS